MHKVRSGGRYLIDPAKHGHDKPRLIEPPTVHSRDSGEAIAHAGAPPEAAEPTPAPRRRTAEKE